MITLAQLAAVAVSCFVLNTSPHECIRDHAAASSQPQHPPISPLFTGKALDVVLTAQAALVWDVKTGQVLYERNADVRRPVASLAKLASTLLIRKDLPLLLEIEIPAAVRSAQRRGANIQLPVGQHTTVQDLLGASLTASANDAMVALAVADGGSEEEFVKETNRRLPEFGVYNTKLASSTGLEGGEQYSTASDIRRLLTLHTQDPLARSFLSSQGGVLSTREGAKRAYKTTNKLLGTYLTVVAAKTGYTVEAGQNLALLTRSSSGQEIGAVVLGSDERFQDMKILVEWINRNYTWP